MKLPALPVVASAAASLLLLACSQGEAPPASDEARAQPRAFSQAEKEAARLLAPGAEAAAADPGADPVERAVRCRAALAALREGLGGADVVTGEQLAALNQAEALFERVARERGGEAGRSPAQIEAAMRAAMEQRGSVADEARQALACVRQLQQ